ncbi:anhydro-N-acetylmuramic acid kinase [Glaesserella parasuis]|uniref:Anhydro-N-acetylmuramic acid kinase n=3 Tax=Glaesserella parasuis TaxID=738 RepID=A0A1T0ACU3_GLAPU|nr:anhydro-N-acetylmuramic acid kinase [Glaesserella parasuis]AGO15866.1 anhydro-N-acetylmuramic acid kinase [Glaesserella parasuis ZJ0906]EQA06228.1 anhydro-N-acetylmuramic acid kinase [Glaesserella parasuis 12939]EQA06910.1 anhydro-N-acetylmuramic acid kinase [Glaesserella parasuis H465]KDB45373.1 anhydro-N-acetylmuramic acid kinase [Glaesserella parasuis HPS10]KDB49942.1 anhydro-N-acetylmuramic acid kinase [Glaesserella parasuis HPS11]
MVSQNCLGVMSGTSLDGVDLALVNFSQTPKLIAADFTPMPDTLRVALSQLVKKGETSLQTLGELDHQLALLYADSIQWFLAKHQLNADDIVAVGCHGQTVWHSPKGQYPFTMQIGDMNLLAARTGITTVGDFRRRDMAFGGQGAPLVPAFHQAVFSSPERLTVVLNIGGISNISVLNPNQQTIGYDVGAGNTLLDIWIEKHLGKRYDANGEWARTGKIHSALLALLLDEPFFQLPPPKSTGRELFNLEWLEHKLTQIEPLPAEDVQATLVEFTVQSIVQALRQIENPNAYHSVLLVCGGGAKNPLIMERLQTHLIDWQVSTTTEYGLDVDYVEAAAFAWLAYQRIHNLPANLPSVTGATQEVSLGAIFPNI